MATSNPYITNPVISIKEAMSFLPNDLYSVKPVSFNDATQEWQKITSNDLVNDARNIQNQQQELELQNQKDDKDIQDKIANDLQQKFGTDTDTTDTDEKYKEMLSYAEKEYIMKGRVDKAYKLREAQNSLSKMNQPQTEYRTVGSDLYAIDKTSNSFTKVIDTPDKVAAPKLGSLETLYDREGNPSYVYKNSPEYLDAIQNKGLVPESAYKQDFERRKTIEENKAFNPSYTPPPELSQSVFETIGSWLLLRGNETKITF